MFVKKICKLLIVIFLNLKLRRVIVMKKYVLCLFVLLSGCGTWVTFSHRQNGADIYTAQCNGAFVNISFCYRLASQACNGNFEVISSSVENAGSSGQIDMTQLMGPSYSTTPMINRSIMFYCK